MKGNRIEVINLMENLSTVKHFGSFDVSKLMDTSDKQPS